MNDEERRLWVENDEGLYCYWRAAKREERISQREWIRKNRTFIDSVINNVTKGKKPAHYLRYGG